MQICDWDDGWTQHEQVPRETTGSQKVLLDLLDGEVTALEALEHYREVVRLERIGNLLAKIRTSAESSYPDSESIVEHLEDLVELKEKKEDTLV